MLTYITVMRICGYALKIFSKTVGENVKPLLSTELSIYMEL